MKIDDIQFMDNSIQVGNKGKYWITIKDVKFWHKRKSNTNGGVDDEFLLSLFYHMRSS